MSDFSIVKVFNYERHTPWKYTLRILVNLLGFQVNHWDFDGSQSDFHNPWIWDQKGFEYFRPRAFINILLISLMIALIRSN